MIPRLFPILLALAVLLLSGCIVGNDRFAVANELASLREQYVPLGLIAPPTEQGRQDYRVNLIKLRPKVSGVGEGKATLLAYFDASLESITMQEEINGAFSLLQRVKAETLNCNAGTPADLAMQQLRSAQTRSESVHASFLLVQKDIALTNALGAEYVTNAASTTENISISVTNTLEQIRQNCV